MELGFEVEHYERLFKAVTGRQLSWEEMLAVSEKVWQLTRAISAREIPGFGRAMDYPPERMMSEPASSGPNEGHCVTQPEVDALLDDYYQIRGWDKNGIPTAETLKKFGLDDVAATMESWACQSK